MTATEIITQAQAVGVNLSVAGGKLVVTGQGRPDSALVAALREHKAEIVAALTGGPAAGEDTRRPEQRYGCAPDEDIPLAAYPPHLPADRGALLTDHILRQGGAVRDWCLARANAYSTAFPQWSFAQHDQAAALDAILWQRGDRPKSSNRWDAAREIADLLAGLEKVAQTMKERKP